MGHKISNKKKTGKILSSTGRSFPPWSRGGKRLVFVGFPSFRASVRFWIYWNAGVGGAPLYINILTPQVVVEVEDGEKMIFRFSIGRIFARCHALTFQGCKGRSIYTYTSYSSQPAWESSSQPACCALDPQLVAPFLWSLIPARPQCLSTWSSIWHIRWSFTKNADFGTLVALSESIWSTNIKNEKSVVLFHTLFLWCDVSKLPSA